MSLILDYFDKTKDLKEKYGEKSIVFMQVGSFYEVYGCKHQDTGEIFASSIELFQQICDFSVSEKKKVKGINGSNVVMAGFPETQLEKYIEKVQSHHFTIAVYTQTGEGKNIERELTTICSPGTYFTEDHTVISNYIVCIAFHVRPASRFNIQPKIIYGLSALNIITGKCNYTEHQEVLNHNPCTFDFIERYISIFNPNEVIFLHNSLYISQEKLDDIVHFIGVSSITKHFIDLHNDSNPFQQSALKCEQQNVQRDIIQNFYPNDDVDSFFETHQFHYYTIACHSFTFLLEFVNSHNKDACKQLKHPQKEYDDNHLYLANHSLKQLNIISDNNFHGKTGSIVEFMDHCYTIMGKRMLREHILHPITDPNILETKYNRIQFFIDNTEHITKIRNHLKEIYDIEKGTRKIIMNKSTIHDIISLYTSCKHVQHIIEYCMAQKDINKTIDFSFENLNEKIVSIIKTITRQFNVYYDIQYSADKDTYDLNLLKTQNQIVRGVYSELDECESNYLQYSEQIILIREYFSKSIHKQSKKSNVDENTLLNYCKIHTTDKSGIYFKTTNSRGTLLNGYMNKQKKPCELILSNSNLVTISNELQFVACSKSEKKITNNDIQTIISKYGICKEQFERTSNQYFKLCIESLKCHYQEFQDIVEFIAEIDIILSHSIHAKKYNYCKPVINLGNKDTPSFIKASHLRHPLIEILQTQETYVSNDIEIGDCDKGILLFGTNAVGKSSLIKSIGISVILAQSGCFVPCSSFLYKPYYKLFTRILGNDNIFKGLSTFAVEMSELNVILRNTDEHSLVLGDELCSGTEMGSAISIFVSGLKHLHDHKSSFMFATHFHEVVNMKQVQECKSIVYKHLSVIYEPEKQLLIYNRKLQDGPGNNLYGLEVCKSLKLPQSFLEYANDIRLQMFPENTALSSNPTSRYNAKKIKSKCEICNQVADDIHHLIHQKYSNENGYINHIPKNHKANLMSLCKDCHMKFHNKDISNNTFNDKTMYRKTKTSNGMILQKI
jgi:DNA mismatch repair protein MutS